MIGDDFDREAWRKKLGLDEEPELKELKWHELVGQALLAWPGGQLHRLLEQQEQGTSTRVRRLLIHDYYVPYLPRLLSGDVDLDRCDFILRDALQTGVAYGRYDVNWLVSTATGGETAGAELVVGFDRRKAPRVVEQFLVARRALYDTVYFHKTVRSAEGMIGLLLRRMKEIAKEHGDAIVGREALFVPYGKVIGGEPLTPDEVLGLDDYSLWVLIQKVANMSRVDATMADLAQKIIARDLFKQVPCDPGRLENFLSRPDSHERLKDAVSPYSVGDSEYYVHLDRATFRMFCDAPKEQAYFIDADGEARSATKIVEHEQLWAHRGNPHTSVRLYAPREAVGVILEMVQRR